MAGDPTSEIKIISNPYWQGFKNCDFRSLSVCLFKIKNSIFS